MPLLYLERFFRESRPWRLLPVGPASQVLACIGGPCAVGPLTKMRHISIIRVFGAVSSTNLFRSGLLHLVMSNSHRLYIVNVSSFIVWCRTVRVVCLTRWLRTALGCTLVLL